MNQNICRIILDLTRERRDIDTNNEARNTVIYGQPASNQASIRRFYTSPKQNLKQKTLHNLFFC